MTIDLEKFKKESSGKTAVNKKFLRDLKAENPRRLDDLFHEVHEDVFSETDCLTCANCCKTTSPIFYQADIERAARALRLRPGDFVTTYLRVDQDGDNVLKTAPCPFLASNNLCSIYEDRPRACREYPHTNRKKMTQLLDLTQKNTLVCPAVLEIVERMKRKIS